MSSESDDSYGVEGARSPILIDAKSFPPLEMRNGWRMLTETIKRDIKSSHEARMSMLPFCRTPLSEDLPNLAVTTVSSDGKVGRLMQRFKKLEEYLRLPQVPDESLSPDITHARFLMTKDAKSMIDSGKTHALKNGAANNGVTLAEKAMVAQRYVFARDIKILAFGSELIENPDKFDDKKEFDLPSGTHIRINTEDEETRNALLDPANWDRREQIKDRVHVIKSGNKEFIIKERKTSRHTDTAQGGHFDGLSSKDEFLTAEDLYENGQRQKGSVRLTWEKPLGYVEYPDGFSFVVFEHEGKKIKISEFRRQILEHKDKFQTEFESVNRLQLKYGCPQLGFEEFAKIKSEISLRQSEFLYAQSLVELGYENTDEDRFNMFRVKMVDDKPMFELVGMDLERMRKVPVGQINKHQFASTDMLIDSYLLSTNGVPAMLVNEDWIGEGNELVQECLKNQKENYEYNLAIELSEKNSLVGRLLALLEKVRDRKS